uniref:Uncharacterized protein n=1 Tax=Rhizophora mucronata TaxID=61149 RepID=A0A2P2N326_RHIMU
MERDVTPCIAYDLIGINNYVTLGGQGSVREAPTMQVLGGVKCT